MGAARGVYFPNLNGLRFVAALAVIVHHSEQLKAMFGLPSVWGRSPVVFMLGQLGVILFFVLSGFLITYLLLEEERRGVIQVGRFYLRRALRIWPLYYLIVGLSLFVLPRVPFFTWPGYGIEVVQSDLAIKTALYATLFANVVLANLGVVPYASQTWSIGTEEQFYLIWPLLMKHVRNKLGLMLGVIVVYLLGSLLLSPASIGVGPWQSWVGAFYDTFNIDCMAIGGLAAVILHRNLRPLAFLFDLKTFYATLALTVTLVATGWSIPRLSFEAYSVLFAVLVVNLAANPRIVWSLEFAPIHYLGKISYGLYMLHPLAIVIAIRMLTWIGAGSNLAFYPLCLAIAIGLAAASYRFLESPFLWRKDRYANIVSGERARDANLQTS